ncbi:MAG: leucine-rich repeat domain-containing protein [Paludibacteraceae bacterium]|nr:leucine-rich repeat domain-containing protein [Paludibacteraceae bacterium]
MENLDQILRFGILTDSTCEVIGVNDYSVEKVVIPSSVEINGITYAITSIRNRAFMNCNKLRQVVVGSGVESIGELAFAWCDQLSYIRIPFATVSIDEYVFVGCSKLNHIDAERRPSKFLEKTGCMGVFNAYMGAKCVSKFFANHVH